VNELFVMAVWAASLLTMAARIAFQAQRAKLTFVMNKLRQGMLPAAMIVMGFAPMAQAHSMPGQPVAGASIEERGAVINVPHDGISLDEAVRKAEAQFRARVVRTEVQDEDGRKVYVLKLLSDDGRVITVRIDAATGRMR